MIDALSSYPESHRDKKLNVNDILYEELTFGRIKSSLVTKVREDIGLSGTSKRSYDSADSGCNLPKKKFKNQQNEFYNTVNNSNISAINSNQLENPNHTN